MRSLGAALAACILTVSLSACGDEGGSGDDAKAAAPPSAADPTFPGGQPLSHYKGMPSYAWRVAIVEKQDQLLKDVGAQVGWFDVKDLGDLVQVCDAISRGQDGAESVRLQLSEGPEEQVSAKQATAVIGLIQEHVCG